MLASRMKKIRVAGSVLSERHGGSSPWAAQPAVMGRAGVRLEAVGHLQPVLFHELLVPEQRRRLTLGDQFALGEERYPVEQGDGHLQVVRRDHLRAGE